MRVWVLLWGAVAFGRSPTKVPCPPPLSCGGGTGAREPPPSPPAILRAWLDAGTPPPLSRAAWLQPGEQRPRERLLGA